MTCLLQNQATEMREGLGDAEQSQFQRDGRVNRQTEGWIDGTLSRANK